MSLSPRILSVLLAASAAFPVAAQVPQVVASEPASLISPDHLANLVAPVALYPDQLLSQVLAASTYPLEIIEAHQWLQRNPTLQGAALMDAAKRQNWDPSIQALVAFPDTMALLTRDVQWTTALGNAFLAQQADVMNAIQQMRGQAQNNGRLASTAQQIVTTEAQYGQNAIEIQPANPAVMYVPAYDPQYVWGQPREGDYPSLGYDSGGSSGFGFGDAVNIGSFLTGFAGLLGSGGWGWALNWFTHSLLLNGLFFNNFGFHGGGASGGYYGGRDGVRSAWVHDPGHRLGVPYSNRAIAGHFGGSFRPIGASFTPRENFGGGWRTASSRGFSGGNSFAERAHESGGGWHSASNGGAFGGQGFRGQSFNNQAFSNRSTAPSFRGGGGGFSDSRGANSSRARSFASPNFSEPHSSAPRFSGPQQHFSAPRMSTPRISEPKMSAPRFSGSHFSSGQGSGGRSSGGHSSGGHGSGGHSSGAHSHGSSRRR